MATLQAPTIGYRYKDRRNKWSKVHLKNQQSRGPQTVCGLLIWVDEEIGPDVTLVNISDIAPEDICRKCLGAMTILPSVV